MSQYKDTTGDYKFREAITIVPNAGTTVDVTITLQTDDAQFWDNVDATGKDIRVTTAGGLVLIPYVLTGLVYATKTLAIDLDAVTVVANVSNILWLYYGNSSAIAPAAGAAVAGAIAGKIDRTKPSRIIRAMPQRPGDTKPRDVTTKGSAEAVFVYVDFTDLIAKRRYVNASQSTLEEPSTLTYTCATAGSPVGAMIDVTLSRWIDYQGRRYAKVLLKAGTTATDYVVTVTATTSESQTLEHRFRLRVRDTLEA